MGVQTLTGATATQNLLMHMNLQVPLKVIKGPETQRVRHAISLISPQKFSPEAARKQTENHRESARRNLLAAGFEATRG
jgi:hypothetical protein